MGKPTQAASVRTMAGALASLENPVGGTLPQFPGYRGRELLYRDAPRDHSLKSPCCRMEHAQKCLPSSREALQAGRDQGTAQSNCHRWMLTLPGAWHEADVVCVALSLNAGESSV